VLVRQFGGSDKEEEKITARKVTQTMLGMYSSSVSEQSVLIAHIYAATRLFVCTMIL